MKIARRRFAPVVVAASALFARTPADSRADGPESADDPGASISVILEPCGTAEPGGAERQRIIEALARSFSWTDLSIAWSRATDSSRGDVLLAAIAALPADARAEFFGIASQPGVRRFLRNAAFGVVRVAPDTAGMSRVMALCAAIPEREFGSPFATGPLRDAVTALLARSPGDIAPLRDAWATLDPALREALLDGIAAAGPRCGSRTLSEILVAVRPADAASIARLANLPVHSDEPWAQGTDDLVRAALASDDPVLRRCGARLAGRLAGTTHVPRLVALLGDPDCACDAQGALRSISGVDLLADAELWAARLSAEEEWARRSWPAEREALGAVADPDSLLAAIERVSERRYHAVRIAPALEPLARSGTPEVRVASIRVLGRLGRPAAIRLLSAFVHEQDQRIALAASDALARITGLAAPATPSGWQDLLAL